MNNFKRVFEKCNVEMQDSREGIVKIEAGAEVMWKGEANVHISHGFKLDHIINSSLPAALVAAFCMHRVANILPGYLLPLQVLAPGTDIPPLIQWRTAPLSDIGNPFAESTFDIMIIDPRDLHWFIYDLFSRAAIAVRNIILYSFTVILSEYEWIKYSIEQKLQFRSLKIYKKKKRKEKGGIKFSN